MTGSTAKQQKQQGRSRTKKPGRPRKNLSAERSHDLKGRILETTVRLIAQRGFDGFTLRDVASVVGVHTALVGYYFGTKDKLEQAALDSLLKQGEAALLHVGNFAESPPEQALKAMFIERVKFLTADSTMYRFMLWVLAKDGKYTEQLSSRLRSPAVQMVTGLIRKALPGLNDAEYEARSALLFSLSDGCTYLYWSFLKHLRLKSQREKFLEEYYHLVEHLLLPELFQQR